MRRVETLRQQATILRVLAQSFEAEMPAIAKQAVYLGKRCHDLADQIEHEIGERMKRPIASHAPRALSPPTAAIARQTPAGEGADIPKRASSDAKDKV